MAKLVTPFTPGTELYGIVLKIECSGGGNVFWGLVGGEGVCVRRYRSSSEERCLRPPLGGNYPWQPVVTGNWRSSVEGLVGRPGVRDPRRPVELRGSRRRRSLECAETPTGEVTAKRG